MPGLTFWAWPYDGSVGMEGALGRPQAVLPAPCGPRAGTADLRAEQRRGRHRPCPSPTVSHMLKAEAPVRVMQEGPESLLLRSVWGEAAGFD